jgi:hypothetical protein
MSRKPYRLGSDVSNAIDLSEPICHEVVVETAQIFDKDVTHELAAPCARRSKYAILPPNAVWPNEVEPIIRYQLHYPQSLSCGSRRNAAPDHPVRARLLV